MKYATVAAPSRKELAVTVTDAFKSGWRVQGGVCVTTVSNNVNLVTRYYQALVKTPTSTSISLLYGFFDAALDKIAELIWTQ